jgi:lipopolysaccharide transport system permease protein
MDEIVYQAGPELAHARRFFGGAIRDLRSSGPVAWRLFIGDIRVRHRRSMLGYAWLVVPALAATALGLYLQSHRIVHIDHTTLPYGLHVLAGLVIWQVFVDALASPLQQLSASRPLLTTTRIAYEPLLLAGLLMVLLGAAIRLVVLVVVLLAAGQGLGASVLLVPLGLALVALLGLGPGLLLAPVGLLYEDVGRTLPLVTAFWFFLTPILYPAPSGGLLRLNPVTPLLDTTRTWLTSATPASGFFLASGLAFAGVVVAWLVNRLSRFHVAARLG